jgi:site-specific DNA recombinase
MTATAWTYLRVSSVGQTTRAFSEEGYSIEAQRADCQRKAAQLEAELTEEFVDSAESARTEARPSLQKMRALLHAGEAPTYIIVHKVDRFARNRRDDANILFEIMQSGAKLVSATETIDDSPSGQLTHGILAAIAEYYSLNLSAEAKKGLHRKAKLGGTPGLAPVGYLNVRETIDGREIRTVQFDPERAPHVRWAFIAYSSGAYTLDRLVAALHERGLRSRHTAHKAPKTISRSQLAHMLANPYYIGIVRYGGVEHQGRHEPLIDRQTFDRVQAVLDAHNRAASREWKHHHYLKGSLRCARCGNRLTFVRAKGNGGRYDYFACIGRIKRTGCTLPYLDTERVETYVAQEYARLALTDDQDEWHQHLHTVRDLAQQAVGRVLDVCLEEARQQRRKARQLEAERKRLLHAFYEDAIPLQLLRTEQDRITAELNTAAKIADASDHSLAEARAALAGALDLLESCVTVYEDAHQSARRQINQALFACFHVDEAQITEPVMTEPFRTLADRNTVPRLRKEISQRSIPTLSPHDGSNVGLSVGAAGFEPATPCSQSRCATRLRHAP